MRAPSARPVRAQCAPSARPVRARTTLLWRCFVPYNYTLLGKEKNTTLPNILLEAKTYKYIKSSAVFAVNLFQIEEKLTDGIKKETQPLK